MKNYSLLLFLGIFITSQTSIKYCLAMADVWYSPVWKPAKLATGGGTYMPDLFE
jgi:hypothetical protein